MGGGGKNNLINGKCKCVVGEDSMLTNDKLVYNLSKNFSFWNIDKVKNKSNISLSDKNIDGNRKLKETKLDTKFILSINNYNTSISPLTLINYDKPLATTILCTSYLNLCVVLTLRFM